MGSGTLVTAAGMDGVDDFSVSSVALSDGAEPVNGIFHTYFFFVVAVFFWTSPTSLI